MQLTFGMEKEEIKMPNWCFTDLEIRGKDAVKFWEMLERARYRSCKTDDGGSFGEYWLGHYLIGAGISKDDATYGSGKFDCRGSMRLRYA